MNLGMVLTDLMADIGLPTATLVAARQHSFDC
jgi:hypothetical protein